MTARVTRPGAGVALAMIVLIVTAIGSGRVTSVGALSQVRHGVGPSVRRPSISGTRGLCQIAYSVDRLTMSRSKPLNRETFTVPAKVVVAKSSRVQAAARALCALPPLPKGVLSCPMDLGVEYTFHFTVVGATGNETADPVVLDASGCETVKGLGTTRWVATSPSFWPVLGNALGIARATQKTFAGVLVAS